MTTPRDHRLAAPPRGLPPVNVDGRRIVHAFGRTEVNGVSVDERIVDERDIVRVVAREGGGLTVVERVFPPRVGDE